MVSGWGVARGKGLCGTSTLVPREELTGQGSGSLRRCGNGGGKRGILGLQVGERGAGGILLQDLGAVLGK